MGVALLGIIRRWHLRDQVPLREIARRLGISRNTIRRYIRAETIEPAYVDRRPRSSLDKYTLKLSEDQGGKITQATSYVKAAPFGAASVRLLGVVRSRRSLRQTLEDGSIREGQFGKQINR